NDVDLSIFCGDILGYGRDIDFCVDFILSNVDITILGNHDRLAITNENLDAQLPMVKESIFFARSKLSLAQKEIISSLPEKIQHENMHIVHSIGDEYLRNEDDFKRLCRESPKDAKYVFFGHTHEQVLYKYQNKIIVNPGSITKGRNSFPRSYVIIQGENTKFVDLEVIL
ncbi:unnamed protein product, partial [marine sediment metagenome]